MFKKILLVVAAGLVVFLVVVALQPSDYHVERTTTIVTEPAQVFPYVNDFHKLVESNPDKAVKIKVAFTRPFEGGINSDFSFTPKGDQMEVAWAMHGTHNFREKAFCLVFNGLKMMGNDIDKGLAQLKSVVEQI